MTDFLPDAESAATAPTAATSPQAPALVAPVDGMESTGQEQPGRGKTRPVPAGGGTSASTGRPARRLLDLFSGAGGYTEHIGAQLLAALDERRPA